MAAVELKAGDGTPLHADYASVPERPARAAAVLLHPHPVMGGDMNAAVPHHLAAHLPDAGVSVLRVDFRGAGGSGGSHSGGEAEALDVAAAALWLREAEDRAVWLVGWSFGADVSLQVTDDAVAGWVAVAPPLRTVPLESMAAARDARPKLLLVPEHDQFCGPGPAAERTGGWEATRIDVVPGADHFLAGRLDWVNRHVLEAMGLAAG